MFDRLDEVRSAARARAVEDFEYFVGHVLGPHTRLSPTAAAALWERVVEGEHVAVCPSETFSWLFPELCRRAA